MGHQTERLRQRPAGLRVGRIALVEDRKRGLKIWRGEVAIERGKLFGGQQALINDCAGRQRTDIGTRRGRHFDLLAQAKQRAFQVPAATGSAEEALSDGGQCRQRPRPDDRRVSGHFAPAQTAEPMFGREPLNRLAHGPLLARLKKHHAGTKSPGQPDPAFPGPRPQKPLRHRHQQSSAVPAAAIGVHTSAMRQPVQGGQRALHDLARRSCTQPGHKADTTSVVVQRISRVGHPTLLAATGFGSTTQNFDVKDWIFRRGPNRWVRKCPDGSPLFLLPTTNHYRPPTCGHHRGPATDDSPLTPSDWARTTGPPQMLANGTPSPLPGARESS